MSEDDIFVPVSFDGLGEPDRIALSRYADIIVIEAFVGGRHVRADIPKSTMVEWLSRPLGVKS